MIVINVSRDPYKKQDTESKITIENQFETGEGYIPRLTVAKPDSTFDMQIKYTHDKLLQVLLPRICEYTKN